MRSSYLTSHSLLPFGQSLWFDFEQQCLTVLAADQHIEQQSVLSHEALTFLADLFVAHPSPLERHDEQMHMLLATCNDHLKILHLAIETVSPNDYQLTVCPSEQGDPIQEQVFPHPLVYMRLDWRRGMYTIPPFLL